MKFKNPIKEKQKKKLEEMRKIEEEKKRLEEQRKLEAEQRLKIQKRKSLIRASLLLGLCFLCILIGSLFEDDSNNSTDTNNQIEKIQTDEEINANETVKENANTTNEEQIDISTVIFGTYPQDGEDDKKAIEWYVIKEEDNKCLLLSKYILDNKPYNDSLIAEACSWSTSTLRNWLNNEFYSIAFSDEEKQAILITNIDEKNAWRELTGDSSQDYVFLLNCDDFYSLDDSIKATQCTNYAKVNDCFIYKNGNSAWWLLSPKDESYKMTINDDGDNSNCPRTNESQGIRPAIWVDKSLF